MMHTGPVPGEYKDDWKPTKVDNPDFKCRKCGSDDIWYRNWESSDGAYDDVKYECRGCKRVWWVESSDS